MSSHSPGPAPSDIRIVTNQAPPLVGHNVVTTDHALVEAVSRHADAAVVDDLVEIGAQAGTAEAREHGILANENHPHLTEGRQPSVSSVQGQGP